MSKEPDFVLAVDPGRSGGAAVLVQRNSPLDGRCVLVDWAEWSGFTGSDLEYVRVVVDRMRAYTTGATTAVVVEPAILARGGTRVIWSAALSAGPFMMVGDYYEAPNGTWQSDLGLAMGSTEERKRSSLRLAAPHICGTIGDSVARMDLLRRIADGNHHLADAALIAVWALRRLSRRQPLTSTPPRRTPARGAAWAR